MNTKILVACSVFLFGMADFSLAAGDQKWNIKMSGLEKSVRFFDDPSKNFTVTEDGSGFFIGSDSNRDGALTMTEISELNVLGYSDWFSGYDQPPRLPDFYYSAASGLRIAFDGYGISLVFGDHMQFSGPSWPATVEYFWKPTTVTVIEGPALTIPEPSSTKMMAMGLGLGLALAYLSRRVRGFVAAKAL